MAALTWDVYVSPSIPAAVDDLPPGLDQRMWSPISATLISGERDAVLVDPLMTVEQADALADWVTAGGKNLTTVYATHGHGDHWFGAARILARFPQARMVASAAVVAQMRKQIAPEFLASFWQNRFPGQIPAGLEPAEALEGSVFTLEGHELVVVDLGHTDTDDTTALHVPSIGLVVAGDAVYNDVHLYLAESPASGRQAWLRALDTIESLDPRAVIAGHKRPDRDDDPKTVEETRQYLRDFDRAAESTSTTLELYEAMRALHGGRVNLGALWGSARSAKG